jgi:hypothetical protein
MNILPDNSFKPLLIKAFIAFILGFLLMLGSYWLFMEM